ncbi:protein artichoke [Scaptodrosophila lebanonensis]|uniref:Protein artichoke n=1 Tax=Drosophila lebanonensis TaxID=7225 RepID=A0A6J2T5H2_DROLE|nr:protein artichoke [Scaptodrosophila lebanonensis]
MFEVQKMQQQLFVLLLLLPLRQVLSKDVQECQLLQHSNYICREIESFKQLNERVQSNWQSVRIVNEHRGIENDATTPLPKLAELRSLDLSDSKGLTLSENGFRDFEALEQLNITYCQLDKLQAKHLQGIVQLRNLDASFNDIQEISRNAMEQLPNLVYANLSNNLIASVELHAFKDLKHLQFLDMTTNEQGNVTIGDCPSLLYLSISNNNVRDFAWCHLRGLPKLRELHLHSNWLEVLDTALFETLPELRVLNVSNNNIYAVSPELFTGASGEQGAPLLLLDYSSNNVRVLPDLVFSRLNRLETLNLWSNQLSEIGSKAFVGLKALRSLRLQGNKISRLPDNVFANLNNLERLDLSRNTIREIGSMVFGETLFRRLTQLDLSVNSIEVLHPLAFASLPFLQSLKLKSNKLTHLDVRMFAPLRRLQVLTLSENWLPEIESDVLTLFEQLLSLEINNNRLTFLPALNATLSQLRRISVEGNPWQCACLDELTSWLDTRKVAYANAPNAYFSGQKPLCVVTPVAHCIRDLVAVRAHSIIESYDKI